MSEFYDKFAATAQRQIVGKGTTITIKSTASSYDPVTGETSGRTVTEGTFYAVSLPVVKGKSNFDETTFEQMIMTNGAYFLVAAKDVPFIPATGQTVIFGGKSYSIIGVSTLAPDCTPVIYFVGCKPGGTK